MGTSGNGATTPVNNLHKRKEQLTAWESSDANKAPSEVKNPEKVKFKPEVAFLAACNATDFDEIDKFLCDKVDINTSNVDGLTALHQACIDNKLDLIKFLIDHGADIHARDSEGWTPLHATALGGHTEVAKYLLKEGAKVGIANNDGDLPIDVAESWEMKQLLKESMARIDENRARNAEALAMQKDARAWLKEGRYRCVRDPRSHASPLHVAAAKGYSIVLSTLLQCPGVDINDRDCDGWTPLHAAAHWGQESACRVLAAQGADMAAVTHANQTVLDIAEEDLVDILKDLQAKQAELIKLESSKQPVVITSMKDENEAKPYTSRRLRKVSSQSGVPAPPFVSSVTRVTQSERHDLTSKSAEFEKHPEYVPRTPAPAAASATSGDAGEEAEVGGATAAAASKPPASPRVRGLPASQSSIERQTLSPPREAEEPAAHTSGSDRDDPKDAAAATAASSANPPLPTRAAERRRQRAEAAAAASALAAAAAAAAAASSAAASSAAASSAAIQEPEEDNPPPPPPPPPSLQGLPSVVDAEVVEAIGAAGGREKLLVVDSREDDQPQLVIPPPTPPSAILPEAGGTNSTTGSGTGGYRLPHDFSPGMTPSISVKTLLRRMESLQESSNSGVQTRRRQLVNSGAGGGCGRVSVRATSAVVSSEATISGACTLFSKPVEDLKLQPTPEPPRTDVVALEAHPEPTAEEQQQQGLLHPSDCLAGGDRRVSAIMEKEKVEESETERRRISRRNRATKRATQGVAQDVVEQAKKLVEERQAAAEAEAAQASAISDGNATSGNNVVTASSDSDQQSQQTQQQPSTPSRYAVGGRLARRQPTIGVTAAAGEYDSGRGSSQGIYSSSAAAAAGDSSPSTAAATTTSGSTTGLSRSRPGSYHGSVAAAAAADPSVASNTASSASSAAVDYKRLYEKERANSERLGAENSRLREENEQLKRQASEQRQVDKRLSEYEAQNRAPVRDTDPVDECEKLRSELERLRADNLSLIRVLSRLKPQQQQQQNAS